MAFCESRLLACHTKSISHYPGMESGGTSDLEEADGLLTRGAREAHEVRDGVLGRFGGHSCKTKGFQARSNGQSMVEHDASQNRADEGWRETVESHGKLSPPHDAKRDSALTFPSP